MKYAKILFLLLIALMFYKVEAQKQIKKTSKNKSRTSSFSTKHERKFADLKIEKDINFLEFSLENVKINNKKFETLDYENAIEETLGIGDHADSALRLLGVSKELESNDQKKLQLLCIAHSNDSIISSKTHPLISALRIAYAQHKGIEISPDMIWLLMLQALGIHINENANKLRNKIVDFKEKKIITVEVKDDFNKKNVLDWESVITQFKIQIKNNISEDVAKMTSTKFSTTTTLEQLAFDVSLMHSMQPYFDYEVAILCGIPTIKLTGTIEDWQALENAAVEFKKYGLDWWVEGLLPILREFVQSRSGIINREFWANIFEESRMPDGGCSTVDYLNGWILKFFPYIEVNGKYLRNPLLTKGEKLIRFKYLPLGITKASVKLKKGDFSTMCYIFSGFVGITQYKSYLKPKITWGVIE